jgi:hypothetical protein
MKARTNCRRTCGTNRVEARAAFTLLGQASSADAASGTARQFWSMVGRRPTPGASNMARGRALGSTKMKEATN